MPCPDCTTISTFTGFHALDHASLATRLDALLAFILMLSFIAYALTQPWPSIRFPATSGVARQVLRTTRAQVHRLNRAMLVHVRNYLRTAPGASGQLRLAC